MKKFITYLKRYFLKAVVLVKNIFTRKRRTQGYVVSEDILFV